MRGCVHCPVCRWGVRGVCVASLRSGSGEDVPAAVREVEVAVDVVASAVDDMLFFDVCCMCLWLVVLCEESSVSRQAILEAVEGRIGSL